MSTQQSAKAITQEHRIPFEFCQGEIPASHAGKVYRRRFVATRLTASLLADGAPCFPALVIKRDCSYISIHFSLEIAEIS